MALNDSDAEETGDSQATGNVLYWAFNHHAVTLLNFLVNVFLIVVAFWTIFLNAVILDTLLRLRRGSSSVGEVLVACLALSDVLLGLGLLYTAVYSLAHFHNERECMARFGLLIAAVVAAALTLLALTVDRFLKIVSPYRYPEICSQRLVAGVMVAVWLVALLFGLLPLLGWNNSAMQRGPYATADSEPLCSFFGILPSGYLQVFLSVCYGAMVLVVFLYIAIFFVARRHARAIAALPGDQDPKGGSLSKHTLSFTRTVCILVGFSFVCWLPMGLVCLLDFVGVWEGVAEPRRGDFLLWSCSSAFLNSLLNPAIYAAKIPAVRRRFHTLLCCKKPSPQTQLSSFA